jgi:hypothetical protein
MSCFLAGHANGYSRSLACAGGDSIHAYPRTKGPAYEGYEGLSSATAPGQSHEPCPAAKSVTRLQRRLRKQMPEINALVIFIAALAPNETTPGCSPLYAKCLNGGETVANKPIEAAVTATETA